MAIEPETREVEYYRLWDDNTWDTGFIDIPRDTPESRIEDAIRDAVDSIEWETDIPVIVGLYNSCDDTPSIEE